VAIYLVNAIHPSGSGFWSTKIVDLIPSAHVYDVFHWIDGTLGLKGNAELCQLPLNVGFMVFGGLGTIGNIVNA
jgi:ethanolaminephosphotransferase